MARTIAPSSSLTDPSAPQAAPLARYSAYRQAGDFIFLSGIIAVDPKAQLIVKGFADIPVLMHSSLSSDSNQQLGKAVGVDEYVPKFEPQKLAQTLARLLS